MAPPPPLGDTAREFARPEPLLSPHLCRRGVEDFDEYDPHAAVETPRSLQACRSEGIRQQDLVFVPFESFQLPGVPEEVAQLRFEFFEAVRQDLLAAARLARSNVVTGTPAPHAMSPRGDPGQGFRHAQAFFREQLAAINLKVFEMRKDWSTAPRSPEFKRVDMYAQASNRRAATAGGGSPSGGQVLTRTASAAARTAKDSTLCCSTDTTPPTTAPPPGTASGSLQPLGGSGTSWWSLKSSSWRSVASPDALLDTVRQIREAPGIDWRELENAKRVEDTFGSMRDLELKAKEDQWSTEHRILKQQKAALEASYIKIDFDQRCRERYREIRECMSPPAAPGARSGKYHALAREKVHKCTAEEETARKAYLPRRCGKQQQLERWVDQEQVATRIKFAQMTLEDRVRWRRNYAGIEGQLDAEKEGVVEDFRRKQAQLHHAGKVADEMGAIRREIMDLRNTHRVLDECRRKRKEQHEADCFHATLKILGDQRLEGTGGCIEVPDWCMSGAMLRKTVLGSSARLSPSSPDLPPMGPSQARSPASRLSSATTRGEQCAVRDAPALPMDLPDVEALEKLSRDEMRWIRRIAGASPERVYERSRSLPGLGVAR